MLAVDIKKRPKRINAPVLLLLLGFVSVVRAERLPLKTYTTADGLAHEHVRRIVRDSRGFLWFCTRDGLSRCDAYRCFSVFLRLLRFAAAFLTLALVPGAAKGQQ